MISDRSIPIDSLLHFERHRGNEVHVFMVMSNRVYSYQVIDIIASTLLFVTQIPYELVK